MKPYRFPPPQPKVHLRSILNLAVKRGRQPASESALANLRRVRQKLASLHIDADKTFAAVDIGASQRRSYYMIDCLPCLTASRGRSGGHFVTRPGRMLTVQEMLLAQGMDPKSVQWRGILSKAGIGHAIGNAMTQTVVEELLAQLLPSMGWKVR